MGISTRFELWRTNLEFFEARPILGVGWRLNHELAHLRLNSLVSDPEVRKNTFIGHAHNNIIEMLAGTGLVGTLAWMLFNFQVLRMAWNSSRRSDLGSAVAWGVFCAWILLHLNGLTQVNFWEGKVMHQWTFALGLLLGFQLDKQRSSAQEL
jgi:O-antigen ligase